MKKSFLEQLQNENLSPNTIMSYTFTIRHFFSIFSKITKNNLLSYKGFLVETYKPKTVNLKIQALNKYLTYIKEEKLKLKFVKIQRKNFLENVISYPDYLFFINKLKKDKNHMWYFIVRYLGATGARVSELIQIKVENVRIGYIDLYTKGGKIRRIYIAKKFLEKQSDIALLADLMGHESIETTRIYLRRTSEEQQKIVDDIINW